MKIYKLPDIEFKIIISKELNEMQYNRDTQVSKIRETKNRKQ